jgi:hypothetical protein
VFTSPSVRKECEKPVLGRTLMEYVEEEEVNTQRFDITIVWPQSSDSHITDNEISDAIERLARNINDDVVVEVEEIVEPVY